METTPECELVFYISAIEVTRVKYMLRSYLRTRLLKIERYVMHALDNTDVRQRLSPLEDQHATQYLRLVASQLTSTVTSKLPEAFNNAFKQASAHPDNDMIPVPDLGRHVFVRVLRDLGQVPVYEDGGMHELNKGDLYIMRYNMLRPLLSDKSVQLI
jgi:GINS complex subunit 4